MILYDISNAFITNHKREKFWASVIFYSLLMPLTHCCDTIKSTNNLNPLDTSILICCMKRDIVEKEMSFFCFKFPLAEDVIYSLAHQWQEKHCISSFCQNFYQRSTSS